MTTTFTVIEAGHTYEIDAELVDGRLVAPADRPLLGWEPRSYGWCKDDACLPNFRAAEATTDGGVDVLRFAELTGRVAVLDPAERALALAHADTGLSAEATAPDFTLDGTTLSAYRGRKVALVFWASWCGCRYDLPAWQERHAALEADGLTVISIAADRTAEDARPWIEEAGVTHPALIDVDGEVAELYNVINVPTVVWIDEDGRIARPQDTQTATDLFRSMNGLDSEASGQALRRWVLDGEAGGGAEQVAEHLRVPTPAEQRARAHARLAVWLARAGRPEAARRHLATAGELAPHDLAIRRGLLPVTGEDPFGDAFFAIRGELVEAGVPIYRPLEF
ncbi:TlpA disulfide reductase family protein [Kitasatospora sp. NPDC097643]|uniref:TlpA disulfide reductase family protein n=1 Tax=Kitasatospora sp. NPDC097643 TaxID=3157230 RepID=UPI0033194D59